MPLFKLSLLNKAATHFFDGEIFIRRALPGRENNEHLFMNSHKHRRPGGGEIVHKKVRKLINLSNLRMSC